MRQRLDACGLAGGRYLLLSMTTGVLELGAVLYAVRLGWSLAVVLSLGLAYQVGALFVQPLPLSPLGYRLLLCAGLIAGIVTLATPYAAPIALVSSGIGLQGVRDEQLGRASIGTLPKRLARIVGFVIAATFNRWFLLAIPLLVLSLAFADRHTDLRTSQEHRWRLPRVNRYSVLMVTHQSHYFVYCYTLIYVLHRLYAPSALQAAAAFGAGWITYSLAPAIFGRFRTLPVLVVGHILVSCAMVVIAADVDSHRRVTAAWIIGGLGGGTVFCIKRLAARELHRLADELDSWENIGHVTGSACAICLYLVVPLQSVFFAAGCFAILTAILAMNLPPIEPSMIGAEDASSRNRG